MSTRNSLRIRTALLAACILSAGTSLARADTIRVPEDEPTIQAGVDAADDGDTIVVGPGEYAETVLVHERVDLTLIGRRGALIDGTGNEVCLEISQSRGIQVRGLRLTGPTEDAVRITDVDRLALSRCEIDHTGHHAIEVSDSRHVVVERNRFHELGYGALHVESSAPSSDVRFERNVVDGTGTHAVFSYAPNTRVARNRFRDVGVYAVITAGDDSLIVRNVVRDSFGGVIASGARTPIVGCRVENVGNVAVLATGPECIVRRCRVRGAGEGIKVVGTATPVRGCRVERTDLAGIYIHGADSPVDRCRVRGAGARSGEMDDFAFGIVSYGPRSHVRRCQVVRSDSDGIVTYGAQARVERCRVRGTGRDGVATFAADAVLRANRVHGAQGDGMLVEADACRVQRNRIRGAGRAGMRLRGTDGDIVRNAARGSGVADLLDESPVGANRFRRNRFPLILEP